MNLSEIYTGKKAIIVKLSGRGAFKRRLSEMGFTRGTVVEVVKNAPLRDPIEYKVLGYNVSLRRAEAEMIEIEPYVKFEMKEDFNGSEFADPFKSFKPSTEINIALVGNPNAGKTTLFNLLSNEHQHVGNYSGVTVGATASKLKYKNYTINLVDLPGTYSISSYSPEEVYVRNHLLDELPDIVLNVVDSGNLHRNLFLTTQLIDMDLQLVMALNMYDDIESNGDVLNYQHLGGMLGFPMVPTVASKKKGIEELLETIIKVFEGREEAVRHIHIKYGKPLDKAIGEIANLIKIPENHSVTDRISSRFVAIKLLEKDKEIEKTLDEFSNKKAIINLVEKWIKKIESHFDEDTHSMVSDAKYGFIRGALKETLKESKREKNDKTRKLDNFITHRIWGFPIFVFIIWLMFQSTFILGSYPMGWIESLVSSLGGFVDMFLSDGPLKDLLIDGVINGVGGVIIFLPNILILFFFISLMEDTGYMARAAFIMDKLMHKIGLHGKSFIPLIMGFGCNVPAIMATRTIENRSERILTILINPFMSCSARLPVYVLITVAIFPENPGNMIFLMYVIGIAVAAIMSIVFKKMFFRKDETPFVMELPPYRKPIWTGTVRHMWSKAQEYLKKMGGIILIASIIVWALGYFPINSIDKENLEKELININLDYKNNSISEETKEINTFNAKLLYKNEQLSNSYIGWFGKAIEPAIKPLGFDWRMGVSIIAGIPAKEIIVSTMGVLFTSTGTEPEGQEDVMSSKISSQVHLSGDKKGEILFTSISAFSFLLFILIYFPCIATLSAVRKETGTWTWPAFMFFYTTALAYFLSFSFYQIATYLTM